MSKAARQDIIIAQAFRVRSLQRAYFKTRNMKVLQEAKTEEAKLDKLLQVYFSKQETLL